MLALDNLKIPVIMAFSTKLFYFIPFLNNSPIRSIAHYNYSFSKKQELIGKSYSSIIINTLLS